MSGIECINLLAFIQFIIAFDFGLYYLDNKHVLTEIYRKYQKDLKLSVRAVLSRANDIITESLKSENSECILNSAYLDKAYRRLKYLTDENQLDLEGCGFIGLYAGLYGFLCLFCIGMFGSQHEALVKTYILVTSQIVLVIELFISGYNLYQEDCRKYSRNLWSNIRFIFFITLFVVGIVSFDWTYKFFSEFEFPFVVISLIVLLFPLILFIGHIVISRIIVTFVIIKCTDDKGQSVKYTWKALRFMPYYNPPNFSSYKTIGWVNSGLHKLNRQPAPEYKKAYEVHNTYSQHNGAIVLKGTFYIHAGPEDLTHIGWGAAGCVEIIGSFSEFKDQVKELSGSTQVDADSAISELVFYKKLYIEIEYATPPNIKANFYKEVSIKRR